MVHVLAPTVLTSRSIPAVLSNNALGDVAWSQDGQCLFTHRRGVTMLTPYITSDLPPPAQLVDPNLNLEHINASVNRAKRKAAAAKEEVVDMDIDDAPGPSRRKMPRPKGGEVQWWSTSIEVNKDGRREKEYGWTDNGDEYSGWLTDREDCVRRAAWSPSGMNDLGGCLLALLTSHGQLSIYAPQSDASSKLWIEVADITRLTRDIVSPSPPGEAMPHNDLPKTRATEIAWSDALPDTQLLGPTGILAVASRAGKIVLWAYAYDRRFRLSLEICLPKGFANHLAWSSWKVARGGAYTAQLAVAASDGSISIHTIQQTPNLDKAWSVSSGSSQVIDVGDRRSITSLKWIKNLLVWTKSGSVHLWRASKGDGYKWDGVKTVRLERVGGWAGASGLQVCVGIETCEEDDLIITLSSQTRHIVTSLRTAPKLGPLAPSLRLSVGTRDCSLESVEVNRKATSDAAGDKAITINTTGCDAIGWGVDTWVSETMRFHDLDSATEASRALDFIVADLSSVLGDEVPISKRLQELEHAPRVLENAPVKTLLPAVLRILASQDPESHTTAMADFCNGASSKLEQDEVKKAEGTSKLSAYLVEALWSDSALDKARLALVLALWANRIFKEHNFQPVVDHLTRLVGRKVVDKIGYWAEAKAVVLDQVAGPEDVAFLQELRLRSSHGETGVTNLVSCPACKGVLRDAGVGLAKCAKGHEWARCSVTLSVVTTAAYRVCSVCPAISLFPQSDLSPPLAVSEDGTDRDWERMGGAPSDDIGQSLVQQALRAATVCVMCGGRWTRAL